MGDCIFIKACTDSDILINPRKCSKVVIEKCKNTTVTLETTLVSAVAEVIGSENCTIIFRKMEKDDTYLTIQCDKTSGSNLKFVPFEFILPGMTIFSCPKSIDNVITLPVKGDEYMSHKIEIVDPEAVQHRTRFTNDKVDTVPIIREGIGYVTTQEEKKNNDARLEKINQKIEESISEMIKPKKEVDTNYKEFKAKMVELKESFGKLSEINKKLALSVLEKEFFLNKEQEVKSEGNPLSGIDGFDKSELKKSKIF